MSELAARSQAHVNNLLNGSGQEVRDARQHVHTLDIQDVRCVPEEWPALPSLHRLTITVSAITLDQFPRVLCASALPALQSLKLICESSCDDKRRECPALEGRFEQLSDIEIKGFEMVTGALDALLRQLPSLCSLRLRNNEIGAEGCARLAQALEQHACPHLTRLDLAWNKIDTEGCTRLAQALEQHALPSLACLDLGWNKIGAEGCDHLAQALGQGACPNLTQLHLEENKIGNEGCVCLAQGLQQRACPTLTQLHLGGNQIGNEGCSDLASALQKCACPILTHLDLGGNEIGNEGCSRLAQGLQQHACPNLSLLNLVYNRIGNEGSARLALGLSEGCPKLETLGLSRNSIDVLPDALGQLHSLTSLHISSNGIRSIQPALYGLILRMGEFDATGCSLEDPPQEICDRGLNLLKRYLQEISSRGVQELRTARIMLLGDSMHGKTTFCRSLLGGAPCPRVESEERTHALEIHDWIIAKPDAPPLTIKLWDFAGHQAYYATHRSFFSRLCIYVVVAKIEADSSKMQGVIDSSIERLMSICKAVPSGAQVVLVGTFPHDERDKDESRLHSNLDLLKRRLLEADEERVQVWNAHRNEEEAKSAEIYGGLWVDCHSDKHNLGLIAAKLVELADKMVREKQRFPPSYAATLEAHKALCVNTSAGVSSLQAFKEKVGWAGSFRVNQALQFAHDVGILQYYPSIDEDIVFTDPLFLAQAFGALIYDKDVLRHSITGVYSKRGAESLWTRRIALPMNTIVV